MTADTSIEIVTDCSTLPAVSSPWMLGMAGVLLYDGTEVTDGVVVNADNQGLTSVNEDELSPPTRFCCRDVYADRIAERVEQLALSRMKQSQMELWSVRQQRLWANDVSGRLRSILSAVLSLSADVIHLDDDSLEGSESYLRAARTPAKFRKYVRVV